MTHEAARERLLELACGELSGREAARVEAHAAGCEACRAELAELRETRRLMAGLGEIPAPARGEAEILAAARAAAAESAARPRPWPLPAWLLGASAAAAALVTVTAVSYRLLITAPARREDPEALLGRGTARVADPGAQVPAAPPPAAPASKGAAGWEAAPASSGPSLAAPPREAGRPTIAAAPHPGTGSPAPGAPQPKAASPTADASRPRAETLREMPGTALAPTPSAEASRAPAPSVGVSEALAPGGQAERTRVLRALDASPPAARGAAPTPAPARAATPRAATAAARAPAEPGGADVVVRWQELRAAGHLRRQEVATLDHCPGEWLREVETDPQGRVVRYVRHGYVDSVPFVAELYYAEDGALGAVRYREGEGAWRELRLSGGSAAAAGIPSAVVAPARASEVVDAPVRCRF